MNVYDAVISAFRNSFSKRGILRAIIPKDDHTTFTVNNGRLTVRNDGDNVITIAFKINGISGRIKIPSMWDDVNSASEFALKLMRTIFYASRHTAVTVAENVVDVDEE